MVRHHWLRSKIIAEGLVKRRPRGPERPIAICSARKSATVKAGARRRTWRYVAQTRPQRMLCDGLQRSALVPGGNHSSEAEAHQL